MSCITYSLHAHLLKTSTQLGSTQSLHVHENALHINTHSHRRTLAQANACLHALQVASDPLLLGLFEELLKEDGSELYMRAPEVYGVPVNVPKTWDEVCVVGVCTRGCLRFKVLCVVGVCTRWCLRFKVVYIVGVCTRGCVRFKVLCVVGVYEGVPTL